MIEYIRGKIAELTPTQAIIETNGIGYSLNISLNTFTAIQGKEEAKLYVFEQIREDGWTLFGFNSKMERELFLNLLTVSGIGGSTATVILSSFSPNELVHIISDGDERMLKSVKGIGLKTAQRIIVELKDKLQNSSLMEDTTIKNGPALPQYDKEKQDEAVKALIMLGFSPVPSKKAVQKILEGDPNTPVEKIVKLALKML